MNREIQPRLQWIKLYEDTSDVGLVYRRCGISRPTLRKWWQRYQQDGVDGLVSQSRRPKSSTSTKVGETEEQLILSLRRSRNLGARRIQSELGRLHGLSLGIATIHKVLMRNKVKPVVTYRRKPDYIRYVRPVPGR